MTKDQLLDDLSDIQEAVRDFYTATNTNARSREENRALKFNIIARLEKLAAKVQASKLGDAGLHNMAIEAGYRGCERGWNLQYTLRELGYDLSKFSTKTEA